MDQWEALFRTKLTSISDKDPAHDLAHFERVVATAKRLAVEERADQEIVVPAAWLHDFVNVPKNDPRRAQASRISAEAAMHYLREVGYPSGPIPQIGHAIAAH